MLAYFKQVKDLNVNWMVERSNLSQLTTRQQTVTNLKQSTISLKGSKADESMESRFLHWEAFDDITCMCIEIRLH